MASRVPTEGAHVIIVNKTVPSSYFRNAPLGVRLLAIALVAVLPVALLSLVNLVQGAREQRAALERSAMETLRALSTAVDNEISASMAALEILATSPALARDDLAAFYQDARRALDRRSAWENIVVIDTRGQQLMNLRHPSGTPLDLAVDQESVKSVIETSEPTVTGMITSPLLQERRFVVRVPVFQRGRVAYVLGAANHPELMSEMLARQNFPQGAVVAILDVNGNIIGRSRAGSEWYGKPASATLRAFVATGREGFGITTTLEGEEVYTAFIRSPLTRWAIAMGMPRAAVDDPVIASYAMLAAAIVLSLGIGIWGSLIVARTVTGPMALLREVARGIRSGQAAQVPEATIPEVREATEALLAAQAERELLLQREREARSLAEDASRSKDEFLAMLGHELRNPLAAIVSAVTVIERSGGVTHPAAATATGIIQRQSRHLARLLDDLLDVGRVMTGKILLERSVLDLAEVVKRAVDSTNATRAHERKPLSVRVTPVWVNGDASRVEQIVNNLLTNACKYTPPDGDIDVSVSSEGGNAVLRIRDTGLGLEPELLPKVFDLFVQGSRTLDRSEGGLGIGLTLVRRLVELHGGSVAARSEGAGKGSEFEVRMPAVPPPAARPTERRVNEVVRRRVLVVEDNPDAREMLKSLLSLAGHTVHEAEDGPGGVRAALEMQPEVALIDIGLPGCDGYEVAGAIRKALGHKVRLVALTGYGLPEDEQRAKRAGFDEHVVKPVDEATLARVLAG